MFIIPNMVSFPINYRKFTFKSKSSLPLCLDSDSEDELKRSVAFSQRLCELSGNEQQQEDLEKVSSFSSKHVTRGGCVTSSVLLYIHHQQTNMLDYKISLFTATSGL